MADGIPCAISKANVGPDKLANLHVFGRVSSSICLIVSRDFISIPLPAFITKLFKPNKGAS